MLPFSRTYRGVLIYFLNHKYGTKIAEILADQDALDSYFE